MSILMKKVGFTMRETMTGTHHFANGGRHPRGEFPMEFVLDWGTEDLATFLNPLAGDRFMTAKAKGHVTVGGFIENAPCEGTLELRYFTEAKIRYTFTFEAGKGKQRKKYRYTGEKVNLRPWNLHRTHTTCYGTVADEKTGKEVSKSIVYFKLDTMLPFLASFRIVAE